VGVSFAGGIRRGDSSGRGQNAGGLLAAVARSKAALSRQKARPDPRSSYEAF
jgi:hypothetical protein